MNECGFWFWFIRPAAEALGVLAILAGLAVWWGIVIWISTLRRKP